jgi:ferredoxin
MRVWIDQKACVGNGVCEEICPEVFELADGGIAHVRDGSQLLPDGPAGARSVPAALESKVIESAEECPVACIYLEDD